MFLAENAEGAERNFYLKILRLLRFLREIF